MIFSLYGMNMKSTEKIKPVKVVHKDAMYEETFYANPRVYDPVNEQLFILCFLESAIQPGYLYKNHNSAIHRSLIWLLLEGEMVFYRSDGRKQTFKEGTFMLNHDSDIPGKHNVWKVCGDRSCKRYCISIQKNSFLENMVMRFFNTSHCAIALREPERVKSIFEKIGDILKEDYSETALLTGSLIELFCEVALQKKKKEYPQVLQNAIFYIQENFCHPDMDRKNIASGANTSIRTLNRVFLRYLNTTPSAFLQDCRLRKACTLLECSGLSIKEIAGECGFASAGYFTKCFHAQYGCSPRSFRER